ncbi:energy transducer TonB family protein [Salisaeta longa]|uniref:energy transducer TonB family protein n=1 Tax=Salisaeta longa TaxID=503170 RepID=UPI0003B78B18|nr:energy transducer TonB [Salisaeta longa]
MGRSDWIGLGISATIHALLLLLLALLTASRPQPPRLGYVEVAFGEFSTGQPVKAVDKAPESTTPDPPKEPPEPKPKPVEEKPAATPEAEPVDPPKTEPKAKETIPPTEKETTPPQPQPKPEPQKEGADEQESNNETGANQGDPGTGTTEQKAAPYNIEGLNRDPRLAPLPAYAEKVNATIRVRITVAPDGRIVRRIPLMKGNPALENAVMTALQRWRFNRLPSEAPQKNQTGIITFVFRVE